MMRLFAGSIRTYLQAEKESGQSVSFHQTGGLRLAATERELRLFHEYKPQYAELGIPFHIRTPDEVVELHPLIDTTNIFGAAYTPTDGHVDPVGATNALVKAACSLGASTERHCPVNALQPDAEQWILETPKADVLDTRWLAYAWPNARS